MQLLKNKKTSAVEAEKKRCKIEKQQVNQRTTVGLATAMRCNKQVQPHVLSVMRKNFNALHFNKTR